MRFLTRIRRTVTSAFRRNLDLLGVFVLFLALAPVVPVGHILARPDLAPWMMLALSCAAYLRARPIGDGAHPQLTVQLSRVGKMFHTAAFTVTPIIALAWHDAGFNLAQSMLPEDPVRFDPIFLGAGVSGLIAVPVLLVFGRRHEATSWDPPGRSSIVKWLFWALPLSMISLLAGYLVGQPLIPELHILGPTLLCGTAFLATGTAGQSAQFLRQRRAAGQRDGSRYRPNRFFEGLAFIGPSAGMLLLQVSFFVLSEERPHRQPGLQSGLRRRGSHPRLGRDHLDCTGAGREGLRAVGSRAYRRKGQGA